MDRSYYGVLAAEKGKYSQWLWTFAAVTLSDGDGGRIRRKTAREQSCLYSPDDNPGWWLVSWTGNWWDRDIHHWAYYGDNIRSCCVTQGLFVRLSMVIWWMVGIILYCYDISSNWYVITEWEINRLEYFCDDRWRCGQCSGDQYLDLDQLYVIEPSPGTLPCWATSPLCSVTTQLGPILGATTTTTFYTVNGQILFTCGTYSDI